MAVRSIVLSDWLTFKDTDESYLKLLQLFKCEYNIIYWEFDLLLTLSKKECLMNKMSDWFFINMMLWRSHVISYFVFVSAETNMKSIWNSLSYLAFCTNLCFVAFNISNKIGESISFYFGCLLSYWQSALLIVMEWLSNHCSRSFLCCA